MAARLAITFRCNRSILGGGEHDDYSFLNQEAVSEPSIELLRQNVMANLAAMLVTVRWQRNSVRKGSSVIPTVTKRKPAHKQNTARLPTWLLD